MHKQIFASILIASFGLLANARGADAKLEIQYKDVPKQTILVVKQSVKPAELVAALGSMFGKVAACLAPQEVKLTAPMAHYIRKEGAQTLTVSGGFFVPEIAKGQGDVVKMELPAGKVAFAIHTGPYENLSKTYDLMLADLKAKQYKSGEASWEIYITDPGNTKPEDYKTEVYIPVEVKK